MPYDPSKDRAIASRTIETGEGRSIEVVLASYAGARPKIGLSRVWTNRAGEAKHARTGRLALDEARRVVDAITSLLAEAEAADGAEAETQEGA